MTELIKVVTREYDNYHTEKLYKLWQIKTAEHNNQGRNDFRLLEM